MARGFPDFFGQSVFPVHGSVVNDTQIGNHSASGAADSIHSITGKGIVRGFDGIFVNNAQHGDMDSIIYLKIDGTTNLILAQLYYSSRVVSILKTSFGEVSRMNWVNCRHQVHLLREIPFITSVELLWDATYSAGAPAYDSAFYYSLYA